MHSVIHVLTLISIIGCGLIAGIFFAFSTFIMQALSRLDNSKGIEAMQLINVTVLTPWFLVAFMGTAALCLILGISTFWSWVQPGKSYLLIGCLFYFIGTFLVTIVFNVPMNNVLKDMDPATAESSDYWKGTYLTKWVFWNHVRTAAAVLGAIFLMIAIR